MQNKNHSLHLFENKIEILGIEEIIGYGDKEVTFRLSDSRIVISGNGLNCESVDVEKGRALLSGNVTSIIYRAGAQVKGLLKRLIK